MDGSSPRCHKGPIRWEGSNWRLYLRRGASPIPRPGTMAMMKLSWKVLRCPEGVCRHFWPLDTGRTYIIVGIIAKLTFVATWDVLSKGCIAVPRAGGGCGALDGSRVRSSRDIATIGVSNYFGNALQGHCMVIASENKYGHSS